MDVVWPCRAQAAQLNEARLLAVEEAVVARLLHQEAGAARGLRGLLRGHLLRGHLLRGRLLHGRLLDRLLRRGHHGDGISASDRRCKSGRWRDERVRRAVRGTRICELGRSECVARSERAHPTKSMAARATMRYIMINERAVVGGSNRV